MRTEIDTLHRPFMAFLRSKGIPFVCARSDRESTIAEGHPDFTLLCNGRTLLIEFKTKEGTVKPKQKERIAELEQAGCAVHVLRDLGRAMDLVNAWHSALPTITVQPAGQPSERLVRIGNAMYRETPAGMVKVRNVEPTPVTV